MPACCLPAPRSHMHCNTFISNSTESNQSVFHKIGFYDWNLIHPLKDLINLSTFSPIFLMFCQSGTVANLPATPRHSGRNIKDILMPGTSIFRVYAPRRLWFHSFYIGNVSGSRPIAKIHRSYISTYSAIFPIPAGHFQIVKTQFTSCFMRSLKLWKSSSDPP